MPKLTFTKKKKKMTFSGEFCVFLIVTDDFFGTDVVIQRVENLVQPRVSLLRVQELHKLFGCDVISQVLRSGTIFHSKNQYNLVYVLLFKIKYFSIDFKKVGKLKIYKKKFQFDSIYKATSKHSKVLKNNANFGKKDLKNKIVSFTKGKIILKKFH